MTYIGAGMICSHLVNLSLLLGAVLSWGVMWPLIGGLKGEWFPATLPESSMKSLNGYKVCRDFLFCRASPLMISWHQYSLLISHYFPFIMQVFISIALILGDGLYNFLKILFFTVRNIHNRVRNSNLKTCKSATS